MPHPQNSYRIWLLLFFFGIGLDALGMMVVGPFGLRYGFILTGIILLLLSIVVAGHLQRSK